MNHIPRIRFSQPDPAMAERLRRWLDDWEMDCRLRDATPPEGRSARPAPPSIAPPAPRSRLATGDGAEPTVAQGQIRLLRPEAALSSLRPVYIAILAVSGEECLAAPHSPFDEPAVPGELLMTRQTLGLRVLCLWNARPIVRSTAEAAWWTDDLSVAELADALAVWRHVRDGVALPPGVADRVGPPLVHPLDPRHDYIEEAASEMDVIAGAGRRAVVTEGGERFAYPMGRGDAPLELAAEPSPAFGSALLFAVAGRTVRIHASPGISEGTAEIRVLTPDGRLTRELDGCHLCSLGSAPSQPIRDGRTAISWSALATLVEIACPDDNRLPLSKI